MSNTSVTNIKVKRALKVAVCRKYQNCGSGLQALCIDLTNPITARHGLQSALKHQSIKETFFDN